MLFKSHMKIWKIRMKRDIVLKNEYSMEFNSMNKIGSTLKEAYPRMNEKMEVWYFKNDNNLFVPKYNINKPIKKHPKK